MTSDILTQAQIDEITAFTDIQAPPPQGQPTAHFIFGTNQLTAAESPPASTGAASPR